MARRTARIWRITGRAGWASRPAALLACGGVLAVVAGALAQTAPSGGVASHRARPVIKGEFAGEDPVGLAAGQHIPTDCSVHQADEDGRTYCFASGPSRDFFNTEDGVISKAEAFWSKDHPGTAR